MQASTDEKVNRNMGKYTMYQYWVDLLKKDIDKRCW